MLHETVESLDDLKDMVDRHKDTASKIILFFMASIDPATGQSWCPDCRDADPVVNQTLNSWSKDNPEGSSSVFITAYVGQRTEWKSPCCVWRGEPYFLKSVPTLMIDGKEGRLEEGQLLHPNNILDFLNRK